MTTCEFIYLFHGFTGNQEWAMKAERRDEGKRDSTGKEEAVGGNTRGG